MKNNNILNMIKNAQIQWKPLGDITKIKTGTYISKNIIINNLGNYPVINSGKDPLGFINKYNTVDDPIGIASRGSVGHITWQEGKYYRGNLNYSVTIKNNNLIVRFLYHMLLHMQSEIKNICTFTGIPALNASKLINLIIPIPPLVIQEKIVQILDKLTTLKNELTNELTNELNSRKKQYEYYLNKLFTFKDNEVKWLPLEKIFNIFTGGDAPTNRLSAIKNDKFNIPILSNGIGNNALYGWTDKASVLDPSLTISARGTIGWVGYQTEPFFPIVRLIVLTPKININLKFYYYFMKKIENKYNVSKNGIPQLTKPMIKDMLIPLPSPKKQKEIAERLDKMQQLSSSIKEKLTHEIKLRKKQYEYYRKLLLSFPKKNSNVY